ncbi:hypothetical protein LTR84_006495 [Exophiala bonariae]|uniref:Uncharacterized protein n=1 Tax=Exophiala bonariae TaxID=1690606 RepID=A0AAV9N4J8_9EURO|nr:hypothetical protein LTR84_006495 [Exophiala bonariae]
MAQIFSVKEDRLCCDQDKIVALKLTGNHSTRNTIPIKVDVTFSVDRAGEYFVAAWDSDGGFRFESDTFTVLGGDHVLQLGPFYASCQVDCPFRAAIDNWAIYDRERRKLDETNSGSIEMYIFLGSTALPLEEYVGQDVHVRELIWRTIPRYFEVAAHSFAQVRQKVVTDVMFRFWHGGGQDFEYDMRSGASSFLKGNWVLNENRFELGRMLLKQSQHCNCDDLAALMYAAFKSFGKKQTAESNGNETDVRVPFFSWTSSPP